MRACEMAPAHIVQGSSVTHRSQSSKPLASTRLHRRLERQDFGMVKRVGIPFHPVLGKRQNGAGGIGHGCRHRHLAGAGGIRRRLQKHRHDIGPVCSFAHADLVA